jgi:hypothetical protein
MELCLGCRANDKLHNLSDSKIAHHAHQMFNFMRYLAGGERLMLKVWLFRKEFSDLNPKIFCTTMVNLQNMLYARAEQIVNTVSVEGVCN